ncbi:hypothetical protein [Streptomyces pseudogriseolus]|uniref:hypothetical protein n=1 Tax=Streptomyces pseudogriseolus TaxID=36817 RepID=UPI0034900928
MSEQPALVTGIRRGLDIRGLDRGQTPVADWLCGCGHHERATGNDITALTAKALVGICPHTTATKEAA